VDISVFHWVIQEPLSDLLSRFERIVATTELDAIATTMELSEESPILGGVVIPGRDRTNPDLKVQDCDKLFSFHCYIRHHLRGKSKGNPNLF
jgi:hypothetical protein